MTDAWKQHHDLVKSFITEVEVRPDLKVQAIAHERGVRVSIGKRVDKHPKFGTPGFVWKSTGKRNVGTMRELAQAIIDACDFVDANNPEWAARRDEFWSD